MIPPAHALEEPVAFQADDLRTGVQLDLRTLLDAADQVARHGLREGRRAHEPVHALGPLGEEHRRLPSGVAASDYDDLFVPAELGLDRSRPVVHARSVEPAGILHRQSPERACTTGRLRSDRKSTRLNSSHTVISYAVFCLKK